jgi:hypothetical protein
MKTYRYVVGSERVKIASLPDDDPSNADHYEGTVTLKVPSGMERMELNAKRADNEKKLNTENVFKKQLEMVKTVKEHVVDVDLKKSSNGFEINDWDTLLDDRDGVFLVGELYNVIVSGMSLGNGCEIVSET